MLSSRRRFLLGAGVAFVAAPAIVRVAANLMPISTAALPELYGASPAMSAMREVLYLNRTIFHFLEVQSLRDRNVLGLVSPGAKTFAGIPIQIVDRL